MPPPYAAIEDTNTMRPHRWLIMCSTTPFTRIKDARRLTLIKQSNSSRDISSTLGTRFPYPAFEIRMSGWWPCLVSICWNMARIWSADPTSTWWIEMRSLLSVYLDCISDTRFFVNIRFVEYVSARWTPCCASWCAHAAPILYHNTDHR